MYKKYENSEAVLVENADGSITSFLPGHRLHDEYKEWKKKGGVAELIKEPKKSYKEKRLSEYPSYNEVAEALMEDAEGDSEKLDNLKAKRAAIKAKYPKE